ncbi:MAG: glutathione s-transferase gst3 [Lasallia pustulata]|uniref:Glutathione s-transferase gst3 n=1 Tax=Lasallia pustulata TaxID=136370 RepID=A0A5M8Q4E2_9LECA|nr:MAG: glutathione s-transferase gst3 [Lasallia pustulata]
MFKHHNGPFVLGSRMTELDIKLYNTLVRFETIYVQHFKLTTGTIRHNYPFLNRFLKNMYWNVKVVRETTNFRHIKENYSKSHVDVNPKSITPLGPFPEVEEWTEKDEKWRKGLEEF